MAEREKRRLPVLKPSEAATPEQAADEERPPWHWSAFGAVVVFLVWLPLAMLANGPLAEPLQAAAASAAPGAAPHPAIVAMNAAAFAIASFLAGLFVGRFGVRAGRKEAAIAGLAAAVVAWGLGAYGASGSMMLVLAAGLAVMAAVGAGCAYAGGALGLRLRR